MSLYGEPATSTSRVGMATQIAGVLIQSMCIAMPYWRVFQAAGGSFFQGLWLVCSSSRLNNFLILHKHCENSILMSNPGWVHAVRGLEVLALGLQLAGLILMLCYITGCSNNRNMITCTFVCFLSAILIIIGGAIYGNTSEGLYPGNLTWGYYLSFVGAAFCILSGAMSILESINNFKRNRYTQLP